MFTGEKKKKNSDNFIVFFIITIFFNGLGTSFLGKSYVNLICVILLS